ncbi:MAG: Cell cycle protein, partial [Verrucomicrobiales bacterium]|nr:Cell cycle protein [Verrucomicrobiales bacterium]
MKIATTILIFCVGALLSLGMVMLYSSSMMQVGAHYLIMQSIWCGLGLVACLIAASFDYRKLKKIALPLLGVTAFLLLLVLIPHIGIKVNGARRWLGVGSFRLQPSELAKIALIIFLAYYGEFYQRQMKNFKRGVVIPIGILGVVLGLIFVEPDVGTTLLCALVSAILLLIAGLRWRYFLPPLIIGVIGIGLFLSQDQMRSKRIYSWRHVEETKQTTGHQAWQAMVALNSGGLTGLGLGNGRQKAGFVPEHHTDFILSIIGEELGFLGTISVLLGFLVFVLCGMHIANRACDNFGMLIASGVTFMIGIQAFINIGVVTSALPNKGMPLPFISYGG